MDYKDYNHALIDTVRNSPYLYDPSNKHYKKGRSRVELWEEVSKKLQAMGYKTTGEKCRERWNCLKGRFVKERNTLRKLRSNSLPYVPRFSFYSALKFVEPFLADSLQRQSAEYMADFQANMKYQTTPTNGVEDGINQIHQLLVQNCTAANNENLDSNEFLDSSQEPPNETAPNSVTVHALQKIPLVGSDCAQIYPLTDTSFTNDSFVMNLAKTNSWNGIDQASSSSTWQWYHDELLKTVNFFDIPSYTLGSTYDKEAKVIPSCSFLVMLMETNLYLYTDLQIRVNDIVPRMLLGLYNGLLDEETSEPYFSNFIWPLELERNSCDWDGVLEIIIARYSEPVPEAVDGIVNAAIASLRFDDTREDIRCLIRQLILNDFKESLLYNLKLLLCGFRLLVMTVSEFCSSLNDILEESLSGAVNPFQNWNLDKFRLSCIQMSLQQFKATVAFTCYHCIQLEGRSNSILQKSFFNQFMFHNIRCYQLIYEAQEVSSTPMHEFSLYFFTGVLKKQLEILYTALNLYQDNGFRISESRFHGFSFPENATALYFPICQLLSSRFCLCLTQKMMPELHATLYGYVKKTAFSSTCRIAELNEQEEKRWMEEGQEVRKFIERRKASWDT